MFLNQLRERQGVSLSSGSLLYREEVPTPGQHALPQPFSCLLALQDPNPLEGSEGDGDSD